ncbi:MAG: 50S ribosome-binding GTPase [Planctomycetaceae bacterium]|nr:50S ribosome-binding GTPase [Planctomycetaceae bacterium]
MPANLTPQYKKAEAEYRHAQTPEDELRCLELMLREIPKHKGTDKLQAELKAKISKAKHESEHARKTGKKGHHGPQIQRQGAGRATIIGGPNAGKSQLLARLTRATPEVAPYPFTTREPQPGMMPWEDVTVQLVDTPPITADFFDPNILGLIRGSDLVLLMADVGNDDGIDALPPVLERLNLTKTRLGNQTHLDEEDIGLSFTRTFLVLNKIDLPGYEDRIALLMEFCPLDFQTFSISAEHGTGLEELRNAIYQSLDVVRVYTKLPSKKEADFDRPFTLKRGGTLHDVAELVHRDLAATFKYARVWSTSLVAPGTQMKGDYVIHDKDVVEIHA